MFKSQFHKQAILSRIMSGQFRFTMDDVEYTLVANTLEEKEEADYHAHMAYEKAVEEGLPTEEASIELSIINDDWDASLEKNIEELDNLLKKKKKAMYYAVLGKETCDKIRFEIDAIYRSKANLIGKKYNYAYWSCDRIAKTMRRRILLLYSVRKNNKRLYCDVYGSDEHSEKIASIFDENLITDGQFRELARSDPWRSKWCCGNPFPSLNMTADQEKLVLWSKWYDGVFEHPECPPQSVIDDDDALDGWAIIQNEKQEQAKKLEKANPKFEKAQEVFITTKPLDKSYKDTNGNVVYVRDDEAIREIEEKNTDAAKRTKRKREEYIREKGDVSACNLPDTRKEIQMEINRNYHANTGKR